MWAGFVTARCRLRSQRSPPSQGGAQASSSRRNTRPPCASITRPSDAAPDLAEAYCRRGSVYQEMGKTALALADLDRAIECDPRLASAYLERGKMRTESGDLDGALADFGQLMLIRANDPDSYLHRGICLVKKGLVDDAAADFHRVLKLTNHSDFAEPAKEYLRQILEDQAAHDRRSLDGQRRTGLTIITPAASPGSRHLIDRPENRRDLPPRAPSIGGRDRPIDRRRSLAARNRRARSRPR